jgi:hypothetical protein
MTACRIQYASRFLLHDYGRNYFSQPWKRLITPVENADILLLCGDIGFRQSLHTREFMQYCSWNWQNILWIKGEMEMEINADGYPSFLNRLPNNVQYIDKEGWIEGFDNIYAIPYNRKKSSNKILNVHSPANSEKKILVASYSVLPFNCKQSSIWIMGLRNNLTADSIFPQFVSNMLYLEKGFRNDTYSSKCTIELISTDT